MAGGTSCNRTITAPSSETGRFPANPRRSIVTDAPSRFAMWMAGTLGPTWLPMHAWAFVRYIRDYLDEEREAAAVRAAYTVTHANLRWRWRWRADQR